MRTLVVLCALVAVALGYCKNDEYKPKPPNRCYQCAWSPPTTTTKEIKVPRVEKFKVKVDDGYGKFHYEWKTKTVFDTKTVTETKQGGWEKCNGKFTKEEALTNGIFLGDCEGNCYARVDKNGNIFRGCFQGAFGVDQNKFGCNKQEGAKWCFCKGDGCNNGSTDW